jgi:hypothetical protein
MGRITSLAVIVFGGLWIAGVVCGSAAAGEQPAPAEAGVWQKHEFKFQYMGFTSTYSCDGLADQLQRLLIAAGARPDSKAKPGACAASFGRPDKFANADLVFYTLAPAGTDGVTGEPGAGRWTTVSIAAHSPHQLQTGDCELVEQFRDQVLKTMFTLRNLSDNTRCVPHQESGSLVSLQFATFAGVAGAQPPAMAAVATPPSRVFVYPQRGQSPQQQASDRSECDASAMSQSGFDPANSGGLDAASKRDAYTRALGSCLEGRGYTVK